VVGLLRSDTLKCSQSGRVENSCSETDAGVKRWAAFGGGAIVKLRLKGLSFMRIAPDIAKKEVKVARGMRDRKMQRALMQFFKPANWFTVREALIEAKRTDLIGDGCDCLIPANPPKEALEARRRAANRAVNGGDDDDHYHTVANRPKARSQASVARVRRSPLATGRGGSRRRDGTTSGKGSQALRASAFFTGL
jgi:hypothetical protein